ncbi:MAG TPA: DUF2127 domain-containing protein [Polyangia bacterium]|nr:DUF2127 domain-containing protein [Polyangia bacterium]
MRDTAPGSTVLSAIGFFKLIKAGMLLALGLWALTGRRDHHAHTLAHLAHWTGAFSGRELVQRALARLLSLDERVLHELGVASLAYAAIFLVEGVGLLAKRTWAEWLTVGVTGSFVPLEVYELAHRPTPAKLAALVLNVAIVAYLARRRLDARRSEARR